MDGMTYSLPASLQVALASAGATMAHTLKSPIGCVGIGVHSGQRVALRLEPAPVGHGIVFRRTDLGVAIQARHDHVIDTRLCTAIADPANPSARIGTIEHLMAALSAAGIDNALISVDGPEVPILDGSAANWSFLIACAGIAAQDAPRPTIEILRVVRVGTDSAWAELSPHPTGGDGLTLSVEIAFPQAAIGAQSFAMQLTEAAFRHQVARARTFGLAEEVQALRAAGLARGGSLDNAVVVDGDRVLNPGGLRYQDEFARHKLLDAVGDLALANARLIGRFTGHRCGHRLNNQVLRALFANQANWRWLTPDTMPLAARAA